MTTPRIVAVIPAAGVGSRMQADRPKQYLKLGGKTILEHTTESLLCHPKIERVVIAISADDAYFDSLHLSSKRITVVEGGKERADSVLNGIASLSENTWALVHDAARPCIEEADITALLDVMHNDDVVGGILASPVRDTMKRALATNDSVEIIAHTEERTNLWHALTPQLFPAGLLKQALQDGLEKGANITDEASAMELAGHKVAMISGSPANIKVTHPADLPLAEFYLRQKLETRGNAAL
jgi:2-C-methyl-D-erythritol 4-phosphate cytidylyltransferase